MEYEVYKGDITTIAVDVIVNAANSSLLGGGGVDGAIHRKGGKQILAECILIRNRQGGCPVGEAVITNAGNLPAKKVIHTVGPIWRGGEDGEAEKLKTAYLNCLKLAEQHHLKTIAFPNISTGVYRFPKKYAAAIALETIRSYESNLLEKVIFVCFDEENYNLYKNS
ncbi:MAG: O-acetyl-ADP-ribose deacetylase [Bacteroidetes bacterium]|nr:MAG: O-acetyl-ADP-ribose deacetylase [Bacteroidota bacterium]